MTTESNSDDDAPFYLKNVYYVIRPNATLQQLLSRQDGDWVLLLNEAKIWRRREGSGIAMSVDSWKILRVAQIKLLFMLDLATEYLPDNNCSKTDFQEFLESLLGCPSIQLHNFDKWWDLEILEELDDIYEDVEEEMGPEELQRLAAPQIPVVAEWLDDLRSSPPRSR